MVNVISPNSIDYKWNDKAKQFQYISGAGKGQFLSRSASLSIVRRGIDASKQEMIDLVDRLYDGKIDLDVFVIKQADLLKDIHSYQMILSKGGLDRITKRDYQLATNQIKRQFDGRENGQKFGLKYLTRDIAKGDVSREALRNRIRMYSESGNLTFNVIDRESKKQQGLTQARRVLGANNNHCQSCLSYSDGIWKSLSDVILPGFKCECKNSCNCKIEYR